MTPCRSTSLIVLCALVCSFSPGRALAVPTLSQCFDGVPPAPPSCTWSTGNATSSDSYWIEGQSVPFRVVFPSLAAGHHTTTIQWATTNSGLHAFDYLTTVDRTESVDPCSGVSGCTTGSYAAFAIPPDPNVAAFGVPQVAGDLRCYGCTVDSVGAYALDAPYFGTSNTKIKIWFTSSAANPVLAWGNHVAKVNDWSCASAQIQSGSPYHGALLDVDGTSLAQDRALSAVAVVGPPCMQSALSAGVIVIGGSVTNQTTFSSGASGTVRFYVCGPDASPSGCPTGGQQVGGDQTLSGSPVTSAPFSPSVSQTGYYSFRVEYAPDPFNPGAYSAGSYTDTSTETFRFLNATGVEAQPSPERIVAAPNPASSMFRIEIPTRGAERVAVRVVDVSGRLCRNFALQTAGDRAIGTWDLTDSAGKRVPTGLYLLRISRQDGATITRRVIVLQ